MEKTELDILIDDTIDLGRRILGIDNLIQSLKNEEVKEHYIADLNDLVNVYKEMSTRLETDLVLFIEEEKKQEGPITLDYRRILKSLRKKD